MKLCLLAAAVTLLVACNNTARPDTEKGTLADSINKTNPDSDTTSSTGWENLFDGATTTGWHSYGSTIADPTWKVKDGTLMLDTTVKNGTDLVTDKRFSNFDLQLEWKISPNGNSGILFYVQEDTVKYKKTYMSGPEMQVLDNDGHPDGKITKHRAGDLYDLIKSSTEPVKPVGEWNKAEITSSNGHLELKLNGVTTVSTTLWDDNWKNLIAGSKFRTMPDWGTFRSGKIALQDHGNTVWYRNIRIKKL